MKLALCFSGQPRTFEKSFIQIRDKILNKYDCDIFISTYYYNEEISNKIISLYNPKKINFNNERAVEHINDNYRNNIGLVKMKHFPDLRFEENVSSHKFENDVNSGTYNIDNLFESEGSYVVNRPFVNELFNNNCLCQFYGIYDVSKLCLEYIRNNNTKYDYILRLRMDCYIENDFEIPDVEENQILIN